jgi:hypothetical protein
MRGFPYKSGRNFFAFPADLIKSVNLRKKILRKNSQENNNTNSKNGYPNHNKKFVYESILIFKLTNMIVKAENEN